MYLYVRMHYHLTTHWRSYLQKESDDADDNDNDDGVDVHMNRKCDKREGELKSWS